MDEVAGQFAQLKYAIDTQSTIQKKGTIATSITLGSSELPFLPSSKAFGSLFILSDECNVTVTSSIDPTFHCSLGTIKYSSKNSYFLDKSYIFEAGALIASQSEGNIMLIRPFSVTNENGLISASFSITNISGEGGKTSAGGYGVYPIQTEYLSNKTTILHGVTSITITSDYPNAWHKAFNSTLVESAGLIYSHHFLISNNSNEVTITFIGVTVNLTIAVTKIDAQIAIGWI